MQGGNRQGWRAGTGRTYQTRSRSVRCPGRAVLAANFVFYMAREGASCHRGSTDSVGSGVAKPITNVAGFDDAPFAHEHRGQVRIVGAVCARTRLDGVVSGLVRRDGSNATRRIVELVRGTRFAGNVRAVLLQGIAVAGFNVIDIVSLHESLRVPVIVVMRRPPRLDAVKRALLDR